MDAHRPDVTIVDVRLPPGFRGEGIRAAVQARRVLAVLAYLRHHGDTPPAPTTPHPLP